MPQLARITSTFFTDLITRLGIRPPFDQGFEMSNVVQPVSLVDSNIVLNASVTTQLLGTPQTAGVLTTPVSGTVLADTGALAAGNYLVLVEMGITYAASGIDFQIQRRDAANAASIWSQMFGVLPSGGCRESWLTYVTLSENERVRCIVATALASGAVQANVWTQRIG
jgi:hypothetical protein